jgi:hypothetical protein
MTAVYHDDKERHLDTVEKLCIWKEYMQGNPLNDKHTVMCIKLFGTVFKRGQLTDFSPL